MVLLDSAKCNRKYGMCCSILKICSHCGRVCYGTEQMIRRSRIKDLAEYVIAKLCTPWGVEMESGMNRPNDLG